MPRAAPNDDADDGFEGFAGALDAFFSAARRARGRAARAAGAEGAAVLTLSQYHLLAALGSEASLAVGALAEAAGVAPPTATRMLDGLQRAGLVTRTPCADDRRRVTIDLTPAGRLALRDKAAAITRKRRALYESLTPQERAEAGRLLPRLGQLIEEL